MKTTELIHTAAGYSVFFGENALKIMENDLKSHSISRFIVLCDENTFQHCFPIFSEKLPEAECVKIHAGENAKNLTSCELVWRKMTEMNLDRSSVVVNLGGGMVGDLGGFAAASYKRGIRFFQVPTSLLAMVDASVGGKTGINFMNYKNQLGNFAQPSGVFIYPLFLRTLPDRELRSGFAEMMKHWLIADKNSWDRFSETEATVENLVPLILNSIGIKEEIVRADPFEKDIRKALNFGHTVGHALESLHMESESKGLLHGEAVAAGMIAEAHISFQCEMLGESALAQITERIYRNFPELWKGQFDHEKLIALMKQDKKNANDELLFTLLNGIGNAVINIPVSEEIIGKALDYCSGLN